MGRTVVFLDIDGVLLPFGDDAPPPPEDGGFPPEPLAALSCILERVPEAELVLSSTWRMSREAIGEITSAFFFFSAENGGGPLASISGFPTSHMTNLSNHTVRQWEIAEWLDGPHGDGVTRWVALDDEDLLDAPECAERRARFRGHAVRTSSHIGLTMELAEVAIGLLQAASAAAAAPTRLQGHQQQREQEQPQRQTSTSQAKPLSGSKRDRAAAAGDDAAQDVRIDVRQRQQKQEDADPDRKGKGKKKKKKEKLNAI